MACTKVAQGTVQVLSFLALLDDVVPNGVERGAGDGGRALTGEQALNPKKHFIFVELRFTFMSMPRYVAFIVMLMSVSWCRVWCVLKIKNSRRLTHGNPMGGGQVLLFPYLLALHAWAH